MKKSLIGIDASRAVKPVRTGTEVYSWEIIQAILRLDNYNIFHLYAPHLPKDQFITTTNAEWKILPARRLWSQITLVQQLRRNPPDVLFVPSHVIPFLAKIKAVVTIHDLAYRFFPQSYSTSQRSYLEFSTRVSAQKAKKIIAPSTATKEDLVREYDVREEKIVVVPHAHNREIFKKADANPKERPLTEEYVLFIGRIEEKKNVRLLVDAFEILQKTKKNLKLVLAGSNGFGFEKVQERINQLPPHVRKSIIQPGYLPQFDLVRYLRHASVFAFPSLYEGFGMPVIEAMAVGTPVVCSSTRALSEVAGDAAELLSPNNPIAWAQAFEKIIDNPAYADSLRKMGYQRAETYSWEKSAELTLKAILDVAHA